MARFYAEIEGQSGNPVHRLGSAKSGARAAVRGWNAGITVYAEVYPDGSEAYSVYLSGGSNSPSSRTLLATHILAPDGTETTETGPSGASEDSAGFARVIVAR